MSDLQPSAMTLSQAFTDIGFSVQTMQSRDVERTYSITIPKHQVEWLRAYGIIHHCGPTIFKIGNGVISGMFCEAVFTLKDLDSTFPKSDPGHEIDDASDFDLRDK